MFIDSDRLSRAELEALAARLPGPHAWTHISEAECGSKNAFICQACFAHFAWSEPIPADSCEPFDMPAGAILLDELPLAEFVARHGRSEAERRIAESFSAALDRDVEATIDAAGTVYVGERVPDA